MSRLSKARRSPKPGEVAKEWSVPGKVFLIGEYAVLAQMPAIVAALGPRFRLRERISRSPGSAAAFHPDSPAGRLLSHFRGVTTDELADARYDFIDPYGGAGGFGASSAQFTLLYASLAEQMGLEPTWQGALKLYRELTSSREAIAPSGADVVAQWTGGIQIFDPREECCTDVSDLLEWGKRVLVFSATGDPSRKVRTHEHLAEAHVRDFLIRGPASIRTPLTEAVTAVRRSDLDGFAAAISQYAERLQGLGLEHPAASADRVHLSAEPGVLAVKGTGALLADAVILILKPNLSPILRDHLVQVARERNLALVSQGLIRETGVLCQTAS